MYRWLIAFALVLMLCGCIGQTQPEVKEPKQTTSTTTQQVASTSTTQMEREPPDIAPPPSLKDEFKDAKRTSSGIVVDGNALDWSDIPVFIADETGDVFPTQTMDGRQLWTFDVTGIKLARDGNDLYGLIEFDRPLNDYFKQNKEYVFAIGKLFFDTDNSIDTGGAEFFSEIRGFESRVDFSAGVANERTSVWGSGYLTDFDESELEPFFVVESSQKIDAEGYIKSVFGNEVSSRDSPEDVAFAGKYLEFKIPLSALSLSSKDTVRILFSEGGSGLGKESFSEPAVGVIPAV